MFFDLTETVLLEASQESAETQSDRVDLLSSLGQVDWEGEPDQILDRAPVMFLGDSGYLVVAKASSTAASREESGSGDKARNTSAFAS